MQDNNGQSTERDEPRNGMSSSSEQSVISQNESCPIGQSSIHPQLKPGRDKEASIFETRNLTASNPAPEIAEAPHTLGSAFVSAVQPQYPSEASCRQTSVNITGSITPEGPDHGVPNKQECFGF